MEGYCESGILVKFICWILDKELKRVKIIEINIILMLNINVLIVIKFYIG